MFCRLWLLNVGILTRNAAWQLLLIAVSEIVLYCVKRSKDAGKWQGHFPLLFQKGRRCIFHHSIVGNFMVYQDRIETNLWQLFAQQKNPEWFSIISVIILRSVLLLNRNKNIGNGLLVFDVSVSLNFYSAPPAVFRRVWKEAWVNKKHCCQQSAFFETNVPCKLRKFAAPPESLQ